MNKLILLASVALLAGCATERSAELRAEEEARLSAELASYEQAGPAQSCVSMPQLRGNRSVGEAAIIFEGAGNTLWVNRPAAGCPALSMGRALQTRTTSSQLCRGDIATVFDPLSGTSYGGCGLGDFTPYRRRDG